MIRHPLHHPFGPESDFARRADAWQDACAEALEIAYLVRRHPEIFTEAFKASIADKPLPKLEAGASAPLPESQK